MEPILNYSEIELPFEKGTSEKRTNYLADDNLSVLDQQRKLMNDPLMRIKQQEMQNLQNILKNPQRVKQLLRVCLILYSIITQMNVEFIRTLNIGGRYTKY